MQAPVPFACHSGQQQRIPPVAAGSRRHVTPERLRAATNVVQPGHGDSEVAVGASGEAAAFDSASFWLSAHFLLLVTFATDPRLLLFH